MDHSRAPVLEALRAFREQGFTPFNPPGHRQGAGVDPRVLDVVGRDTFTADVISVNGLDDRTTSKGVLSQAQELMADAVHADHAFFSTCGSSLSVKSAMLAVAGPHEKLLVARQSHKSVISGLILSGVEPVWVRPNWDGERHLSHPPSPAEVRRRFEEAPDAKGMLLVTPTDYGTCGDIKAVADVCHEFGKPLIVDEAWGAHLPFHPDLPPWAMDASADVCVTSVHKSGTAVEQSSVFHLRGDLVDPAVLKAREDLLGTTSPTSLVYATLDGWRRQMVEHGKELLGAALSLAWATRDELSAIDGVAVMGDELVGPELAMSIDPLKIVLDVSGLGISGYQAADWLREHRKVSVGLADHRRIVAQLTVADDRGDRRRPGACRAWPARRRPAGTTPGGPAEPRRPGAGDGRCCRGTRSSPGPSRSATRTRSGGVSAEMITPYPPGAPAVLPGELITKEVLDYVRSGLAAGMQIPDPVDPSLTSVRVVAR